MIFYKPIHTVEELNKLFNCSIDDTKCIYGGYVGVDEDNSTVGKCLFKIDGYKCYVSVVDCDYGDKLLTEGFLRAAMNFCANRNAYMCYCDIDCISDVLTHLGFENNNGIYGGDIPTLLKGSCCK